MRAFKFTLSGKTAFFKNPEVNTYLYYSYGQIHHVALLGLLGAIMGYKGYNESSDREWPEFFEKLRKIKLAIIPNSKEGIFSRKLQKFNNSTGFASQEAGGNLIVSQIWLEDVSWDIYLLQDQEISQDIATKIEKKRCVYIPYLGSNDHPANIKEMEFLDVTKVDTINSIHSMVRSHDIKTKSLKFGNYKYEEILPAGLERNTERYHYEKMVFTNATIKLENENMNLFAHKERNLAFYDAK